MANTQLPAITFRTLMQFANSLEDWQLDSPVILLGDERGFKVQSAEGLEEDYYIDDEGLNPVSTYTPSNEGDTLETEGYSIVKKGTPYLYTDM